MRGLVIVYAIIIYLVFPLGLLRGTNPYFEIGVKGVTLNVPYLFNSNSGNSDNKNSDKLSINKISPYLKLSANLGKNVSFIGEIGAPIYCLKYRIKENSSRQNYVVYRSCTWESFLNSFTWKIGFRVEK